MSFAALSIAGVSATHFFAMGGYARYLWPCYALTALVVGYNLLSARRTLRQAQRDARRRLQMSKTVAMPDAVAAP